MLQSVGGIPPHIVGLFEQGSECRYAPNGVGVVLDRRDHAIYTVDGARTTARKIVDIGMNDGMVFSPTGLGIAPDGRFAVLDRPMQPLPDGRFGPRPRVQTFSQAGAVLTTFAPPVEPVAGVLNVPGLPPNTRVLSTGGAPNTPLGNGSLQHAGTSILLGHPQAGRLMTEYSPEGKVVRTIGALRRTGVEQDDRVLNTELNVGIPLVDPTGGFYYVFIAGQPMFRKYTDRASLAFERQIEGTELPAVVEPTSAPRMVTAAAVAPDGQLWVALRTRHVYVYDQKGMKRRVLQLRGAGPIGATSLSFSQSGRLLVSPGCYEFDPAGP